MDEKIHNLLRLATDSGASAHEAHTAASIAVTLARKAGAGHLVAKALVAQSKAAKRIEREEVKVVETVITGFVAVVAGLVNPLFDLWTESCGKGGGWAFSDKSWKARKIAVSLYAWAVPSEDAIRAIVECGPVVEIGAGSGYWASLIAQLGGDVVAYDQYEPKNNKDYPFEQGWFPVQKGGPEKAAEHPDRALFLCWPPYNSSFALECLKAYQGNTVIFVGEGSGGCTADDDFFRAMGEHVYSWGDDGEAEERPVSNEWEKAKEINIPQWDGIHDYLTIYRRRKAS
jgi:hypothetical protein